MADGAFQTGKPLELVLELRDLETRLLIVKAEQVGRLINFVAPNQ
jgi:hypothetical protein